MCTACLYHQTLPNLVTTLTEQSKFPCLFIHLHYPKPVFPNNKKVRNTSHTEFDTKLQNCNYFAIFIYNDEI